MGLQNTLDPICFSLPTWLTQSTACGVCKASGIWKEKSFLQPCVGSLPALCASDRKIAAAGWL